MIKPNEKFIINLINIIPDSIFIKENVALTKFMYDSPKVSVIMPVFNAGKYVNEAISSILAQIFNDFELIIINDASTDNSLSIIQSFQDKRIRLINNEINIGNFKSRNKGFKMAKGEYLCTMDADDISLPHRIIAQYKYMRKYKKYGIVGSNSELINHLGSKVGTYTAMNDFKKIKIFLLKNSYFIHSSLMMRRQFLKENYLRYNESYQYAADYDLLVRASRLFPITNLNEVLVRYRLHDSQITATKGDQQKYYADKIRLMQLKYFKVNPSEYEKKLHNKLMKFELLTQEELEKSVDWFNKLLYKNYLWKVYKHESLEIFFRSIILNYVQKK